MADALQFPFVLARNLWMGARVRDASALRSDRTPAARDTGLPASRQRERKSALLLPARTAESPEDSQPHHAPQKRQSTVSFVPSFLERGQPTRRTAEGGGMDEASERLTSTSGVQIARHFDMTNKDVFIYGG